MGRLLLIGLSVLLLALCVGYTGWYFGHIEGFAEAKSRYSNPSNFQSKSNYSNHTSKSKAHISRRPLKTQPKVIPVSALNTTQQLKRQVAKMDRLIKQTGWLNQQQSRKTYSVARVEEKNAGCRWTVGRLNELKRIIGTGGRGRDSQFCPAYVKRREELEKLQCQNRSFSFSGVCV